MLGIKITGAELFEIAWEDLKKSYRRQIIQEKNDYMFYSSAQDSRSSAH